MATHVEAVKKHPAATRQAWKDLGAPYKRSGTYSHGGDFCSRFRLAWLGGLEIPEERREQWARACTRLRKYSDGARVDRYSTSDCSDSVPGASAVNR